MATTDININPRTEELKTEFSNMIWKMATNLVHGGKVNPVQFMDYTLGGLFYRFISENITDYCNQLMRDAGVENADYAHMSDETAENAVSRLSMPRVSLSCHRSSLSMWRMGLRTILSSTPR